MTAQPLEANPTQGLKQVFRRHASAVAAVTARAGVAGDPAGLLVTSLTSVSADPPLISFNVARTASSWPTVAEAGTSASTSSPPARSISPSASQDPGPIGSAR